MSLKRPPRSGWLPCERGRLEVSPFSFFLPSSPQLFHDAAIHRSQLPGSAVAAEPRFSLCDVFYWCWWLARLGARHHTHRLWSPRVRRVRLCEGYAGERSVNDCTLSATERQLFTWTWCECRAGMHSGVFEGRSQPVFRGLPFKLFTCL